MNFFDAMKELEKGNKVRNANWKDGLYLLKEENKICFNEKIKAQYLNYADLNYGSWELYKEPILNEEEKEYISNVIKPFKNRVCYIIKYKNLCVLNEEYIQICVRSYNNELDEDINLPLFVKGSMYKNMKLAQGYSLKELGLDE